MFVQGVDLRGLTYGCLLDALIGIAAGYLVGLGLLRVVCDSVYFDLCGFYWWFWLLIYVVCGWICLCACVCGWVCLLF